MCTPDLTSFTMSTIYANIGFGNCSETEFTNFWFVAMPWYTPISPVWLGLGFGFSLKALIFCHVYTPMHLFSVSTAIPVFALAVVLVNSNLSLALSDFSARIVAFAYTGWDISLSGTAASWSFFSLLLFCSLVILFAFSTYLDFDDSHFEFQIKLLAFFCSMGTTSCWDWISVTSDQFRFALFRIGWAEQQRPSRACWHWTLIG